MTETRHPLAGTYQTCHVCGYKCLVLNNGTLWSHHPPDFSAQKCEGCNEILPIPGMPTSDADLRDQLVVAIDEAGTGDWTYSEHHRTRVDIAADPGDLADAAWSVLGPEPARLRAELETHRRFEADIRNALHRHNKSPVDGA
jgi:hypothetical protein